MPSAIQEKLLKQPALRLSELRKELVGDKIRCSMLYNTARAEWGSYFQSPVDKTARTLKSAFKFNELGAFLGSDISGEKQISSDNKGNDNCKVSYVTEVPFSSFTPTGKTEILHMTKELERLMSGLLVATHLQPRFEWQADLLNYLVSCSSDCFRFLDSFPRYYQNHRMRLVIFPIDSVPDKDNPYLKDKRLRDNPLNESEGDEFHSFPLTCVPWSAGTYLDFLDTYQSIVHHLRAVIVWSIRLFSIWYFVPRRYLRLIAPTRQ